MTNIVHMTIELDTPTNTRSVPAKDDLALE